MSVDLSQLNLGFCHLPTCLPHQMTVQTLCSLISVHFPDSILSCMSQNCKMAQGEGLVFLAAKHKRYLK